MAPEAMTPASPKKRAPTLYFIVAIKLIKGAALLLLALSIFTLRNKDLPELFRNFLQWVHLDPERAFFAAIAAWLNTITPANLSEVASGTFLCGVYLIALGLGLAFRAKWAIWLAIGESAFFIPIEIWELLRRHVPEGTNPPHPELFPHPKLGLFLVLALNVFVVWYLYVNRQRLFRHHY